jgi:acyl carrier protein
MSPMPDQSHTLDIILDVLKPFARPGNPIEADTPLLEGNYLDSAAIVVVLLELEQRLSFKLGASDLAFDHFQSPRTLADRLARIDG